MKSSDSATSKNRSIGSLLRGGIIVVAVIAYFAWLIVPPLETLRYKKYDVQSQKELATSMFSLADVGSRPIVAFSSGANSAAYFSSTEGGDGETAELNIEVIDVKTAQRVGQPLSISQSRTPPGIVFSSDGNFLAAAVATEVRVWDLRDRRLVTTIALPDVRLQSRRHVAISGDGKLLATSIQNDGEEPAIWVFDVETGSPKQKMERTESGANNDRFAFHPKMNQLIGTGDSDSGTTMLCVWDIETGKVARELLKIDDSRTLAFAFNKEEDRVAIAMIHGARKYNPYSTIIFDLDSWESLIDISNDDYTYWLAFSPDGKHLSLADGTGMASVWSTESGIRLQNLKLGPPSATAFSHDDGALLLIVNDEDKSESAKLVSLRVEE